MPGSGRTRRGYAWWLLGAASAALTVGLWLLVAWLVHRRGAPFPGPVETAVYLFRSLGGAELLGHSIYSHAAASTGRWIVGFLGGFSGAVLVAILCGISRALERLLMPLVYLLQLVPGLAWVPVAILVFGLSDQATVFMIVVTALGPIAVNMVAGIRAAKEEHLRVARMAGAGTLDILLHVLLPSSVPHLMSGLRVGLGNSWRVVVAAEMVVGSGMGLGYSIIQSRWTLDYTSAFVCVIVICLIGLLVEYVGFSRLEAATVKRWGMVRS